jgi:hypothetical protein
MNQQKEEKKNEKKWLLGAGLSVSKKGLRAIFERQKEKAGSQQSTYQEEISKGKAKCELALFSTQHTAHSTQYTLHTTHYTLHTTHYTLHTTHYALHTTLYTTHYTAHSPHTEQSTQYGQTWGCSSGGPSQARPRPRRRYGGQSPPRDRHSPARASARTGAG